jgi:hypothetical protein
MKPIFTRGYKNNDPPIQHREHPPIDLSEIYTHPKVGWIRRMINKYERNIHTKKPR